MKPVVMMVVVGLVFFGLCGTVLAQETLIDTVANGCKTEISTYCKSVTPGEGRMPARPDTQEYPLRGRCENAHCDASPLGAGAKP